MKKLILINPVGRRSGFLLSEFTTFPPLGLAYVAAVTPQNWDVKILDENFDPFVYEDADLVGITAFTSNINRAYEIASIYKQRGIKVVMGGIHVSMLPDEALQYVDSVVIGEAEGIWERVLEDFLNNTMESVYRGPQIELGSSRILPRHDLLHPGYFWNTIQTSRGCPFDCHFCSVSRHLGKEYRQRDTKEVLNELEMMRGDYVFFADDNLIGHSRENKERAKRLFQGMIERKLNKKWWMQTTINAAEDEDLVRLASEAGCMFVFIGFESIDSQMLKDMKKGINLKIGTQNYKDVVSSFHKFGVGVLGAFIIGNDHESPAYYRALADYLLHSGIDILQLCILTPLPGTQLMHEMQQCGRLLFTNFPEDWEKFRFSYMTHQPKGLAVEDVYRGNNHIKNTLYSFPYYQYRLLRSLLLLGKLCNFIPVIKMNRAFRKGWLNAHYTKTYSSNPQ